MTKYEDNEFVLCIESISTFDSIDLSQVKCLLYLSTSDVNLHISFTARNRSKMKPDTYMSVLYQLINNHDHDLHSETSADFIDHDHVFLQKLVLLTIFFHFSNHVIQWQYLISFHLNLREIGLWRVTKREWVFHVWNTPKKPYRHNQQR